MPRSPSVRSELGYLPLRPAFLAGLAGLADLDALLDLLGLAPGLVALTFFPSPPAAMFLRFFFFLPSGAGASGTVAETLAGAVAAAATLAGSAAAAGAAPETCSLKVRPTLK